MEWKDSYNVEPNEYNYLQIRKFIDRVVDTINDNLYVDPKIIEYCHRVAPIVFFEYSKRSDLSMYNSCAFMEFDERLRNYPVMKFRLQMYDFDPVYKIKSIYDIYLVNRYYVDKSFETTFQSFIPMMDHIMNREYKDKPIDELYSKIRDKLISQNRRYTNTKSARNNFD